MHRLNAAVGRGGAETLLPALAFFDSERANIELGLRWAIEHADEPESAQILVDYVAGMSAVGVFRCHPTQVLRPLYTAGLHLARRLQEPLLELVTLNNLGVIESNLGNEVAAEEHFTWGQALAMEVAPDEERY